MATNRNDDNLLDQAWVATTDAMDNATLHAVDAVGTLAENASEAMRQQAVHLADKTIEKTTTDTTRQAVIDETVAKNQPNVAVTYAAMTATVSADNHFTDEQKAMIEARIKEIALSQQKDIAPENMQVARVERQHIQNQNKDMEITA